MNRLKFEQEAAAAASISDKMKEAERRRADEYLDQLKVEQDNTQTSSAPTTTPDAKLEMQKKEALRKANEYLD